MKKLLILTLALMCANCYGQTELPSMVYDVDSTGTIIFKNYTPNLLGNLDNSDRFLISIGDSVIFDRVDLNIDSVLQEYQSWNKGFTAGLQTAVDLLKSKTGATDDIEVIKMKMFAEYLKSKQ